MADVLLVDSDPLSDITLVADRAKNFLVIVKDGRVYKNLLGWGMVERALPPCTVSAATDGKPETFASDSLMKTARSQRHDLPG